MPSLINHNILGCYPESQLKGIQGIEGYAARSLCISTWDDVVQLNPFLRQVYPKIAKHYADIGLDVSRRIVWNDDLSLAVNYSECDWDVYLFSEHHHAVRPDESRLRAVRLMNNKNDFVRWCWENEIDVPRTEIFQSKHDYLCQIDIGNYPCWYKVPVSAAGEGCVRCSSYQDVRCAIDIHGDDEPFQLQEHLNLPFLSAQYVSDARGNVELLGLTNQRLRGSYHMGNIYPLATPEGSTLQFDVPLIQQRCQGLGLALGRAGLRGNFAVDFVCGNTAPKFIDLNPRWGGCVYYLITAKRLGATHWVSDKIKIDPMDLDPILRSNQIFSPANKAGAVIINWGTVSSGEVGMLFCGQSYHDAEYRRQEFIREFCTEPAALEESQPQEVAVR